MGRERVVWATGTDLSADRRAAHFSGTPVALMAGFTLAAAVTVVSQRPEGDPSLGLASTGAALLLVASGVFLTTLLLAGWAAATLLNPNDALMWFPEARTSVEEFEARRRDVMLGRLRAGQLVVHANRTWCLGVVLSGVGLSLSFLSYGPWKQTAVAAVSATLIGAAVATIALTMEQSATARASVSLPALDADLRELFCRPEEPFVKLCGVAREYQVLDEYTAVTELLHAASLELSVSGSSLIALTSGKRVAALHPKVSRPGRLLASLHLDVLASMSGLAAEELARQFGRPLKDEIFVELTSITDPLRAALGMPAD